MYAYVHVAREDLARTGVGSQRTGGPMVGRWIGLWGSTYLVLWPSWIQVAGICLGLRFWRWEVTTISHNGVLCPSCEWEARLP